MGIVRPTMLFHLSFFRRLLVVLGLGIYSQVVTAKTYVIPHVLDTSGDIRSNPNSFDTQLTLVSLPADNGSNTPVTVELYLYDNSGAPMTGSIGDVCNPCMLQMSAADRQTNITIGDLIISRGGG